MKGSFDQVPSDALTLTAQAPLPFSYSLAGYSFMLLFMLALVASPVVLTVFAWRRGYRLRRAWLYGVTPTDGPTYLGVIAVLACASLFACYLPARRAARIDPMRALRQD